MTNEKLSPDSKGLGFSRYMAAFGECTVGFVDEVNGAGAVEMPGFVATKYELIQLVKYWATIRTGIRYDWFADQTVGSSETRLESFSGRRIARIAEVLGDEETTAAVQQANADYGEDVDPRIWNVFLNGTPEERTALQEEIEREMLSKDTSEVKRDAQL
jgi:hypothetical protein